jgi:hypothetical protein
MIQLRTFVRVMRVSLAREVLAMLIHCVVQHLVKWSTASG